MDLTNLSWIACEVFKYLLMIVGAVTLFRALCAFVTFLRIAFTRLTPQWIDRYGKGSWALVTGCTEGIGRAFCFELAELGFSLVLVSRNPSKLEALNKDLWKKYPNLNVVICVTDFSKSNRSLYEHIISKISNLDVSLLVNNVGISHQGLFDQLTLENVEELIKVNIESMTYLTHKMIPLFKERKKRNAIINLSSQSVSFTLKGLAVYTATKAYNDHFSRCLSQDYQGVFDVIDCVPAIVSTAGTNYTKDAMSCTSEQCARWTLKALGKTDATAGHWLHIVQSWLTLMVGSTLTTWLGNKKLGDVTAFKKKE